MVSFQNNFFSFSSSKIQFTVNVAIICYSLQWDNVDGCAVLNCKTISIVSIITVIMPSPDTIKLYLFLNNIYVDIYYIENYNLQRFNSRFGLKCLD